MPALDRRILVVTQAEGTRDEGGKFIPGALTAYDMWATLLNDVSIPSLNPEGHRIDTNIAWRIRYNGIVRDTPATRVAVYTPVSRLGPADTPEAETIIQQTVGYQVTSIRKHRRERDQGIP